MRTTLIAVLFAVLALAGCGSRADLDTAIDGADGTDTAGDPAATETGSPAPVRGDIEVAVEPAGLDALPEAPPAGEGRAILGEETYTFAVTFCDEASPIGQGEGEGVSVAWDIREDGDHRASITFTENDERWVRAGPAEAEWDAESRTLRFAGAFLPFRSDDGSQARSGGLVLVCPAAAG